MAYDIFKSSYTGICIRIICFQSSKITNKVDFWVMQGILRSEVKVSETPVRKVTDNNCYFKHMCGTFVARLHCSVHQWWERRDGWRRADGARPPERPGSDWCIRSADWSASHWCDQSTFLQVQPWHGEVSPSQMNRRHWFSSFCFYQNVNTSLDGHLTSLRKIYVERYSGRKVLQIFVQIKRTSSSTCLHEAYSSYIQRMLFYVSWWNYTGQFLSEKQMKKVRKSHWKLLFHLQFEWFWFGRCHCNELQY